MVLSRPAILRHLKAGNLVIDPYDVRHLNTSSYDVTLGPYFWREREPQFQVMYNPYSESEVRRVWGEEPQEAVLVSSLETGIRDKLAEGVGDDAKVILLRPGETILGHTLEFIGGSSDRITTMMKARSSWGRNFIEVCKCAGWGDIPYCNRWTMEITNNSRYYTMPLVVGRRVAQIVFFETEPLGGEDNYVKGGKYQSTIDLERLKKEWNPRMMLPRMHMDYEVREMNKDKS